MMSTELIRPRSAMQLNRLQIFVILVIFMIAGAVYAGASMNEEDDDRANNDLLSAFYGNATASCGPHDITANFTTTTTGNYDITSLYIFSVTPVNFGNLCQGSTNTFSGEVYCDTTVTYPNKGKKVLVGQNNVPNSRMWFSLKCPDGRTANVTRTRYVQPSCTITPVPEFPSKCEGTMCAINPNSNTTAGKDDPPGCRNQYHGMQGLMEWECP